MNTAEQPDHRQETPAHSHYAQFWHGTRRRAFQTAIEKLIDAFPDRSFVLATLEPAHIDVANQARALALRDRYTNVSVLDIDCNPLALFAWLHRERTGSW